MNGNHRLEVLLEQQIEEAMCYVLGEVSDADAKMIALETNELDIEEDVSKVSDLIKSITKTIQIDEVFDTFPWEKTTLFSWEEKTEKPNKNPSKLVHQCPKCGYEFS